MHYDDSECIFWLSGMAGIGKTTIARIIVRQEICVLVSSFRQLTTIRENPVCTDRLSTSGSVFSVTLVVPFCSLDALDECLSKEGTSSILCNLRILITSWPENHILSVFNNATIYSLGQDMAGIEDETMLIADVVDFEGNLKGAFPSELRYAWNARLEHCMSTMLHSSFFHAILHCKGSTWSRVVRVVRGARRLQEQVRDRNKDVIGVDKTNGFMIYTDGNETYCLYYLEMDDALRRR